jgi:hypothetical protein
MIRTVAVLCAIFLSSTLVHADDKPAKDDKPFEAPAPRAVAPPVVIQDYLPYYLPSSLPKPGTREVWQYYGVDSRGRWLPRVVLSPYGAYYSHSGEAFYYTTTQPRLFMPYVVD